MVKSLRFLVILIAVSLFGISASATLVKNTTAPSDMIFKLEPNSADNLTCEKDAVYVSKQLLPSSGFAVHAQAVEEDNDSNTAPFFTDLDNISGTANKINMTFDITNGTYSKNLVLLLKDNASTTIPVVPDYQTATSVSFTIDNNTVSATTGNFVSVRLVDQSDNYTNTTFSTKIDGSLNNGDFVTLSLTSTYNDKHIFNGCFRRVLYIVEDQWIAHLCSCPTGGIDTDYLTASDKGVTVMDYESKQVGFSLYNKCADYGTPSTTTTNCCSGIESSCTLFCNAFESTTTTQGANCSTPGVCYNNSTSDDGLNIYENQDFYTHPSYRVNSLTGNSVTFTLKGSNLQDMQSITLVSWKDTDSSGYFVQPSVIGTFSVTDNNTATVTIPGSTLFVKSNGGIQVSDITPIHFRVEITPKADASLTPNKFYLSAVIGIGDQVQNPALLNWGEFLDWTWGNGSYVFQAPYVKQNDLITSVIRLENAGTKTVGVSLYVNNSDGSGWTFVKHITVAAGTSKAVLGSDLISYAQAAGVTVDTANGFAVRGVASNATEGTFTVYGSQQMVGAGFRPLPIKVLHTYEEFYSE